MMCEPQSKSYLHCYFITVLLLLSWIIMQISVFSNGLSQSLWMGPLTPPKWSQPKIWKPLCYTVCYTVLCINGTHNITFMTNTKVHKMISDYQTSGFEVNVAVLLCDSTPNSIQAPSMKPVRGQDHGALCCAGPNKAILTKDGLIDFGLSFLN